MQDDKHSRYATDLLPDSSRNCAGRLDTYLKQGNESILKAEKLIKESEIDGDNADYFERVAGEADRRELEDASEWFQDR